MGTLFLSLTDEELKEGFHKLKKREDIAALLQISDYQLRYHLYIYPREKAYTTFKVSKKSGGSRLISSPKTSLKIIQKKLNQVFKSVYQPKSSTHGFTVEKSILTNAKQHLRQRYVLNLDLKDFFPSINFGRVRGLLMAPPYNCPEEVATVLAQICCHENQLPQGAPTSPIVSNMICAKLDSHLQRLAKKHQCIYTRYADDITFSTSKSRFPPHLGFFSKESEKLILGNELKNIVEQNGFLVNDLKVRLQTRHGRQEVTGIIVNEKLNIKRRYIRQIRAVLHSWKNDGLEKAEAKFWKCDNKHRFQTNPDSFRNIVRGRIEFVGTVRGKDDKIYLNFLRSLKKLAPDLVNDLKFSFPDSKSLSNTQAFNLNKAIIWTEGKTDLKHLKSALKWSSKNNIKYEFSLDFKEDLDDQKQGSSELIKICEQFCKEKRAPPVIAIFDRDEANIIQKVHDNAKGFKDWGNGVYSFALPTPKHRQDLNGGICIEHYYQDEELQRKDSDNRRLFLSKEFNEKSGKHYDNLSLNTRVNIKSNQSKIIDEQVFDDNHNNVALSKDKFADYILKNVNNFNDFDFESFKEIFEIIEKILKFHYEVSLPIN
jgi:RNA-directed DNA polymerase